MKEKSDFSFKEASFIIGCSMKSVDKVVSLKVIKVKSKRRGAGWESRLGLPELRFISLHIELAGYLNLYCFKSLYIMLRRLPLDMHTIRLGVLMFDLSKLDNSIYNGIQKIREIRLSVIKDSQGVLIFRDINVAVQTVYIMAKRNDLDIINLKYPAVTKNHIDAADDYVQLYQS